jgi:replication-associated recombination protein RarA
MLPHEDLVRIGRAIGRSAYYVARTLAGADDTPEARRVRAMAAEAIGRLPASRRVRVLSPEEARP